MKKSFRNLAMAAVFGLMYGSVAYAQQLKVATGDSKLTYSTMFKQMASKCGNALPLIEQNTNGSMENIDLLMGNQVNGAFVQTDVLFFRARNEDLGSIKTLFAFHPEEVHVLTLNKAFKEGGTLGFGAKEVLLTTFEQLAGRKVGAVGGSAISAQVIRLQAEVQFQFVQYDTTDALMAALNSNQISAAIIVGGAPLAALSSLGPTHRLLTFSEATMAKLKSVYKPARVTYSKMGQGGTGVQTLATEAAFVVREYKTPKLVQGMSTLRTCLAENLDELKETTGMHPKWQAVSAENKGKWAWYELPAPKAVKKAK